LSGQHRLHFINADDGTFTEQASMLGVADTGYGRAILCFDSDDDGDLDILVNNSNGPSRFFLNNLENSNHYIKIKLEQDGSNRDAIGAKISLTDGGVSQMRQVLAGANFESSHRTTQHFGLGSHSSIDSLTITWPDGEQNSYFNLTADQTLLLHKVSDEVFDDGFE